jgi:hypothetical protein
VSTTNLDAIGDGFSILKGLAGPAPLDKDEGVVVGAWRAMRRRGPHLLTEPANGVSASAPEIETAPRGRGPCSTAAPLGHKNRIEDVKCEGTQC